MTTLLYIATEFWRRIRFADRPAFQLMEYRSESMDGAGNVLGSRRGQPKWMVSVKTRSGMHDDDVYVQGCCEALLARSGGFLAYDIRRPWPVGDADGALSQGHAGTIRINSKGSDNRSLSLKNMPLITLQPGDLFSVRNNDGYRQLFRAAEEAGITSANTTGLFQVRPFLPSWVQVDDEVAIFRPQMMFKIMADSYSVSPGAGNASGGLSFTAISVSK
ncbi:hypothetical protein M2360_000931 [Rhizobium sp. SG_E_25_P2]|uniref:hypothetical protein n=1 Tax=Rhizobium sp. SG_E_25_P2 TaxID=2879942 RepID=UPI002476F8D3|nr:hypothetical protein [Rhizobium sp. SG_E_25_P2]MDH6265541.1 hypothetical protein [Rhizobium sp. SG_E_25_P2]